MGTVFRDNRDSFEVLRFIQDETEREIHIPDPHILNMPVHGDVQGNVERCLVLCEVIRGILGVCTWTLGDVFIHWTLRRVSQNAFFFDWWGVIEGYLFFRSVYRGLFIPIKSHCKTDIAAFPLAFLLWVARVLQVKDGLSGATYRHIQSLLEALRMRGDVARVFRLFRRAPLWP